MKTSSANQWVRWLLPAVIPLPACALQWALWSHLEPFVWFMFFPATFASAWIGGLFGALVATAVSVALVAYLFLPLDEMAGVAASAVYLTMLGFALMGLLFGIVWERQHRLERRREADLGRLLDILPAAVWIAQDTRCRNIQANQFARELLSGSDDDRRAMRLRYLQNGRELSREELPVQVAARTGQPVSDIELTVESPDGRRYTLIGGATPLLDDSGKPRGAIAAFQDVSALRVAEEERRLGEQKLRQLVEGLPLLIWSCRPDGGTDYLSPQWVDYTGIAASEQIEDGWISQVHAEDRARVAKAWGQAVSTGEKLRIQCRIRRRDGEQRWFDTQAMKIANGSSEGARWYGFSADFHDVREYLELSDRHAKLIALSFDPIFAWNDRDGIVFWNRGAEQLYGYTEQEALGQNSRALLETRYPGTLEEFENQLSAADQWSGDLLQTARDGREIEVSSRMQRIEVGDRVLVLETHRDITERQRFLQELSDSERRFRQMAENYPVAYQALDCAGHFLDVNGAFCELFGYTRDELLGTPFERLWPAADQGSFDRLFGKFSDNRSADERIELRRKDGEIITVQIIGRSQHGRYGADFRSHWVLCDISERARIERIEREHLETERRLRSVVACLPGAVVCYRIRPDGSAHVSYASDGIEDIYGLSFRDVAEDAGPILERIHPSDANRLPANLAQAAETGNLWHNEYRVRHPRKGEIWVECIANPHREADGSQVFYSYHHDITARKKVEQALRESETRFSTIFRSNPCGLTIQRIADGRFVDANESLLQILGYSRDEFIDKTPEELGLWARPEQYAELMEQLHATGRVRGCEARFRRKSGDVGSLLFSGEFVDLTGQTYLIGMMLDITARKHAERELRESEAQQRTILDTAPVALGLLDGTGRILYVNKACLSEIGAELEQVIGLSFPDSPRFAADEAARECIRECIGRGLNGEPSHVHLTHRVGDGGFREIEFTLQPAFDAQGGVRALVPCALDLTLVKRQENELRLRYEELSQANAQLVQASRLRDEFLATMSHELRTPLTGVLTLSELMQRDTYGPLTDRQRHNLGIIESSGRHLLDLINDILDFARLQGGKSELEMEPVALDSLCRETLWSIDGQAINKLLSVDYLIADPDARVRADPHRLRQMLKNLLVNAVKFTPNGGRIGLDVAADPASGIAEFSVWDTGIGIAPEDMSRLCRPFTQVDGGLGRAYGGTGIGLTLVQRLAEMHGGSISVASERGKGSRFTIRLPGLLIASPHSAATSLRAPAARSVAGDRVLLVDDDELNLAVYRDYLSSQGFLVSVARNGVEALDAIEREHPDLVLMDIQMPVMNGLHAAKKIRASRDARIAATPIVALTALVMPGDKERCLDAGCDDYLSKPVAVDVLLRTIWQHLGPQQQTRPH